MTSVPPLSVLDLVLISEGSTAAETLSNSVDLARQVEQLGYRRYWLAEHHLYPGGAGSASYLLAPTIVQATSTIRVGTAVLIIDNYSPLQVAEIAGTIAAIGGRGVDLGIGRGGPSAEQRARGREINQKLAAGDIALGPVAETKTIDGVVVPSFTVAPFNDARAGLNDRLLSRTPGNPADFDDQVRDVLAFLNGTYSPPEDVRVTATPAEGADVDVWVHGSSAGISASVAGSLGLPFGANYHSFPQKTIETVAAYRDAFVPSDRLTAPHVIVSVDVLVAETEEEAARIAAPFGPWLHTIRTDYIANPYPSPATAAAEEWTADKQAVVADRLASRIVGSPDAVVERLRALVAATGADELVVTTQAHSHTDRINSYRLLAAAWAEQPAT
jgi:alkanesulfonate monooxygenase SsuD/methylene tetrahydromethanopterin reductase-like flavin-dependent oxidoreductase (luciferase family)